MTTASRGTRIIGALALLGLAVAVVMGLTLPRSAEQSEYSRLIAIHPALAWCAYLAFGITALGSALYLWKQTRSPLWDQVAVASAEVGVVFTALTLVTGSIWGRPTWGVWWVWDARLTTTALMLVLYLGYLAARRVPAAADVRARRAAIVGLLAAGLRVRETLLPLLVLPVVAPVLLASTRAWEAGLQGVPSEGWSWLRILGVFAVVYVAVGIAAFGSLLEDA